MAITRVSGLHSLFVYSASVMAAFDGDRYILQRLDNGSLVALGPTLAPGNIEVYKYSVIGPLGTTFTPIRNLVSEDASHSLLELSVAPTANGGFLADWSDDVEGAGGPTTGNAFGHAFGPTGVSLGSAVPLSNAPAGGEFTPSLARLGNGNMLSVWADTRTTTLANLDLDTDLMGRVFTPAGAAVGAEFVIKGGAGFQFGSAALSLGDGRTVVLWGNGTGSSSGINFTSMSGQFLDQSGHLAGAAFAADTIASGKAYDKIEAETLGNGGFVVAWHEESAANGTADEIHLQRFGATGAKVGAEAVIESTDGTHPSIESFHLVGLANGGYAVEWRLSDGVTTDGRVRQFTMAGVEVGAETVMQPLARPGGASGLTYFMNMELMSNGHVMAFGLDTHTTTFAIGVQEFDFGDERLLGTAASETLIGKQGVHDVIIAGAGNDTIYGLSGNDTLTGGAGLDVFVFNSTPNVATNKDTITDYVAAADSIRLENVIFTGLGAAAGPLNAAMYFQGAAAHDASDRIIYNPLTGALFYDSNGSAAGGAVQIATINDSGTHHPATLGAGEFFVI